MFIIGLNVYPGHPAVICEFYAPIITQDTTQTSIMKFAGEVYKLKYN